MLGSCIRRIARFEIRVVVQHSPACTRTLIAVLSRSPARAAQASRHSFALPFSPPLPEFHEPQGSGAWLDDKEVQHSRPYKVSSDWTTLDCTTYLDADVRRPRLVHCRGDEQQGTEPAPHTLDRRRHGSNDGALRIQGEPTWSCARKHLITAALTLRNPLACGLVVPDRSNIRWVETPSIHVLLCTRPGTPAFHIWSAWTDSPLNPPRRQLCTHHLLCRGSWANATTPPAQGKARTLS